MVLNTHIAFAATPPASVRRVGVPTASATSGPSETAASRWHALLGGPPLARDELAALRHCATEFNLSPGDRVYSRQGGPMDCAVWVVEGDVALGQAQPQGGFIVERTVRGPAWLDLASVWLGMAPPCDARAMSQARVIELSGGLLRDAMGQLPSLAERLLTGLSAEVRGLAVSTQALMHKDAQARLAGWLVAHSEPGEAGVELDPGAAGGGSAPRRIIHLRQRKRDIASQLAITPETLSRLMRAFARRGLLSVHGYLVHVHDVATLAELAQVERVPNPHPGMAQAPHLSA